MVILSLGNIRCCWEPDWNMRGVYLRVSFLEFFELYEIDLSFVKIFDARNSNFKSESWMFVISLSKWQF